MAAWWLLVALAVLALPQILCQDQSQTPVLNRGPPASCYNDLRSSQRCLPPFENAAFGVLMETNNTCGDDGDIYYCIQTGTSTRKACDVCVPGQFQSYFLTDLHHDHENQTWWQSETMNEGIQYPNQVNLILNLGKAFDITYVRLVFYSPRPESFAIYKRTTQDSEWEPYQFYSASCRDTYGLPESTNTDIGAETRALCTSEYSDISPLRGGNVAFSTLEGRPSAFSFDSSPELQEWVTATDIRITLDRLNTFGDEVFGDQQVLQSYWYAIADVAVGARCKCNGHASKCEWSMGPNNKRQRMCLCEHNTAGADCEKCQDFYNDAPWGRASQNHVHECKACNCNGYSNRCYFDRELFERTGHGGHCIDCAEFRDGPNCERCKENYYQNNENICMACNCNPTGSRSLQCNSGGKCQCKPGVTGEKCDRCSPNFFQFTNQGCKPCLCSDSGSFGNTPDCDSNTGICRCKEHVEGKRCRECKPGYFNLDYENEFGCTPCFCYGKSSECQSASGYSKVISESNFIRDNEKWTAQNSHGETIGLKYHSKNIGVVANSNEAIYFMAPERFLGDQRSSYNHDLKFTLFIGENSAHTSSSDLMLEGAGMYVSIPIFGQRNNNPSVQKHEYVFRLHEHPDYEWSPRHTDREFMTILSNLTSIRIRGTYGNYGAGFLEKFKLESAQRGAAGHPAMWIEMCACPKGYVGQFCESCAPGFRHNPALGGPSSPCVLCDCNRHASICDSETGRCICEHHTAGDNCNLCAKGYYGNALSGTPYDCKPCLCPNNGACVQMPDSTTMCTECPVGYTGGKCDLCSDGYYKDSMGTFGAGQICKPCECNLNIDTNAVGNCNRTSGECLKCIYNTAGDNCDQCLPGYFGDALAPTKGDCQQCECYSVATLDDSVGIPKCDRLNGQCACKAHVQGRNCDTCEEGYYNIVSGEGCQACNCDPDGSYNHTCNLKTGKCHCREGVTGDRCDTCEDFQYGFSNKGCKECMCDDIGSKALQCDVFGQCPCYENVEGFRCDRCKENKHDRQRGCMDCPPCYNLVQDAVNIHRDKLQSLEKMLLNIEKNSTVISDSNFDKNLADIKQEINELLIKTNEGTNTGSDGKTLIQRLDDFNERLNDVGEQLKRINKLAVDTETFADEGSSMIKKAENYIDSSTKELNNALDYLHTDGAAAFAKAQNRSDQFGQQSTRMSSIAQESRLIADRLENEAKNIKDIAETANATSYEAYELNKKGFAQQKNISDNLKSMKNEIQNADKKLKTVQSMADESQTKTRDVLDNSLNLHAEMRFVNVPTIDTKDIKSQAEEITFQANNVQDKINKLMANNSPMLQNLENQIRDSQRLLNASTEQHSDMEDKLMTLDNINETAKEAVKNVTKMYEEAKTTNTTLRQFHNKVETSRKDAENALKKIPDIQASIEDAEISTRNIKDALDEAEKNAKTARKTAQDAHHKYAKQASQEAHEIRKKAADTKLDASSLYEEAVKLAGRVEDTKMKIETLEIQVKDDDQNTNDAKTKVSQVKTDVDEAEKAVKKGLSEVTAIMDDLENLPQLNDKDLDALEQRLNEAEQELKAANLTERIKSLKNARDTYQQWFLSNAEEIKQLKLQVDNVKKIHDALPDGCYKRLKLEP